MIFGSIYGRIWQIIGIGIVFYISEVLSLIRDEKISKYAIYYKV